MLRERRVGGGGGPFVGMTTGSWRRVLGINLDGAFLTFRAAARRMVERGEGGSLVADGQRRGYRRRAAQ